MDDVGSGNPSAGFPTSPTNQHIQVSGQQIYRPSIYQAIWISKNNQTIGVNVILSGIFTLLIKSVSNNDNSKKSIETSGNSQI